MAINSDTTKAVERPLTKRMVNVTRSVLGRPALAAFISLFFLASVALSGSLTPSAAPGSTFYTLGQIFNPLASDSYDSSSISSDQDGSIIQILKYIEENLGWASVSNNVYSLSSNVGIGDQTPETEFEVVGTASVSALLVGGSPAATASTSGWVDDGTAVRLDTSSDNVGIGVTSPETKLEIAGTASASRYYSAIGTAAAPAYTFGSDTNTGIFSLFDDTLNISTGGTERYRISPTYGLLSYINGSASLPAFGFDYAGSSLYGLGMYATGLRTLAFAAGGTQVARLDGATPAGAFMWLGNGTSDTGGFLAYGGGTGCAERFGFHDGFSPTNTGMGSPTSDGLCFASSGTTAMEFVGSGAPLRKILHTRNMYGMQSITIPDSGDGNPATYTLQPTRGVVNFTCSDADGCDVTMGESFLPGSTNSEVLLIVNSSANELNFTDSSGVSELQGDYTMEQWDTLELLYVGITSWVEIGRSSALAADSLDYTEFVDAMTLDANLTVASDSFTVDWEPYFASSLLPSVDDTYDLGDDTHRWRDLYLGPGTLYIGTSGDQASISYNTSDRFFELNINGVRSALIEPYNFASNTAFGFGALASNDDDENSAFGHEALFNSTAESVNAFGYRALRSNTTGENNAAFGSNTLFSNTTGGSNTAFGERALFANVVGSQNTALGQRAGSATLGSGGVYLGNLAGSTDLGGNVLYIENSSAASASALIYGEFDTDYLSFGADVSVSGNFELTGTVSSNLSPTVDDTFALGTSALRWANVFAVNSSVSNNLEVSGVASISQLFVNGTEITGGGAGVTSNSLDFDEFVDSMTLDANLTIASHSNGYTVDWEPYFVSNLLPNTDDTYDLGDDTHRWRDLYVGPGTIHLGATADEGCFRYNTSSNELEFADDCSSYSALTAGSAGGWTDGGTTVRLTTGTDNVGIGTTTASSRLQIIGNSGATGLEPLAIIASTNYAGTARGFGINGNGRFSSGYVNTNLTYNRIYTTNSLTNHSLNSGNDLLLGGILEVDGQAYFDGSASVSGDFEVDGFVKAFQTGFATAPQFTTEGDTDTGLYMPNGTDNILGLTTGGVAALYIDAAQNIGIGTTTTGSRLRVMGSGVDETPVIYVASTSGINTLGISGAGIISAGGNVNLNTGYHRFSTTNVLTGHALSDGNDLLLAGDFEVDGQAYFDGSASVAGDFEVDGFVKVYQTGFATSPQFVSEGDPDTGMFMPHATDDILAFSTGGTERARIDSSGNISVGTQTSTARVRIMGSGVNETAVLAIASTSNLDVLAITGEGVITGGGNVNVNLGYHRLATTNVTTGHGLSDGDDLLLGGLLEVNGDVYFDANAVIAGNASISSDLEVTGFVKAQNGTAADPSYTFQGSPTTGLYRPGTDITGFTNAGAESMRIDAAGNVGIGTTTTNTRFNVRGAAGNNAIMNISSASGTSYLYMDKAGNIGIANTTPAFALEVQGANHSEGGIYATGYNGFGTNAAAWGGSSYENVADANKAVLSVMGGQTVGGSDIVFQVGTYNGSGGGHLVIKGDGAASVSADLWEWAGGQILGASGNTPFYSFSDDRTTGMTINTTYNTLALRGDGDAHILLDEDSGAVCLDTISGNPICDGGTRLYVQGQNAQEIVEFASASGTVMMHIDKAGDVIVGNNAAHGRFTVYDYDNSVDGDELFTIRQPGFTGGYHFFDNGASFNYGLELPAGTESNPSLKFTDNQGLYDPGANILGFVTSGTERMRINANGNVGIGTTTVNNLLTVIGGNVSIGTGTAVAKLTVRGETGENAQIVSISSASGVELFAIEKDNNINLVGTNAGNVGIGLTGDPDAQLTVRAANATLGDEKLLNIENGSGTDLFTFWDNGASFSHPITFDDDWGVGPNTRGKPPVNQNVRMDLSELSFDGSDPGVFFNAYDAAGTDSYIATETAFAVRQVQASDILSFDVATSGTAGTAVSWTNGITLNTAGNVGINVGVLQVSGTSFVTYNRYGTGTTGHSLTGTSDLLISDDLEVNGVLYADGGITMGGNINLNGNSITGGGSFGGTSISVTGGGGFGASVSATEFLAGNGSAGAPSFTFQSDETTGMYNTGSGVGLTAAGTLRGRFDSSGLDVIGEVDATTGFSVNGTPGVDRSGCASNEHFNGFTFSQGILTGGGSCTTDSNPDYAERFFSGEDGIEPGDIIVAAPIGKLGIPGATYDQAAVRSTEAYEQTALGIVSTYPGLIIGPHATDGYMTVEVALAGRVPVKVNEQNGPISVGDMIAASDEPGVGMRATKAGTVVGMALTEPYASGSQEYVVAFINPQYWVPTYDLSDLEGLASDSLAFGDDSSLSALFSTFIDYLRDMVLTVRKLVATDELCVGETCVNENQLQELLLQIGETISPTPVPQEASGGSSSSSDGEEVVEDDTGSGDTEEDEEVTEEQEITDEGDTDTESETDADSDSGAEDTSDSDSGTTSDGGDDGADSSDSGTSDSASPSTPE